MNLREGFSMSLTTALRQANWLNSERVVVYPLIFLLFYVFIFAIWMSVTSLHPEDTSKRISRDFINVYAAGVAVHEGKPAEVYDSDRHKDLEDRVVHCKDGADHCYSWFYPPVFLSVAWLTAFLPYTWALAAYCIIGGIACGAALYKLVPYKGALSAIVAFPGTSVNLLAGQNGVITTAILAAGLFALDEAPVAAGAIFGVLSYKPQFFVLVPLALTAGRYWKALAATIASAIVYAGFSLIAFGFESWLGFMSSLAAARSNILENSSDFLLGRMHTVYSMARMFGGGMQTAHIIQDVVSSAAVLVLIAIWRHRSLSLAVRGASLSTVLLLASPYSFFYDQVLLAIPIALLAREGVQKGFLSFEKIFLCFLWLLPLEFIDYGEHYALPLTPPMLTVLLFFCWRRMKAELSNIAPARPEFSRQGGL
jgi:hypothetical protein